jgi:orotidine-5'-phosphate decarboxylase
VIEPFGERLTRAVQRAGNCAVVGLDPHLDRLPTALQARFTGCTGAAFFEGAAQAVLEFNQEVIAACRGVVPAIKPQFAFYEALGWRGWRVLEQTCQMAREAGLLVIADAKRGDISSTGAAYARAIVDLDGPVRADAITINPWMGIDTLAPFLACAAQQGTGIFVLVRTTNPKSAFLQQHGSPTGADKLADAVHAAGLSSTGSAGMSSVGAVVGANSPADARALRKRMPAAWFLVPGVGAQGGDPRDALAGARPDGLGCVVSSSRGVLYPPSGEEDTDFAGAIRVRVRSHAAQFVLP